MLQQKRKENRGFLHYILISIIFLAGCQTDTSSHTEEEEAYFADYEAPVNKWGFLDMKGNLPIEPIYDQVGFFSEGLAAVNLKGKWGFIDYKGQVIITPVFKAVWSFQENIARVQPFNQKSQYLTKSGRMIFSPDWIAEDDFSDGLARVRVGNTFGYIDSTGQFVIRAIYSRGQNFDQGLAVIEVEEKFGAINKKGQLILPLQFDRIKRILETNLLICYSGSTSTVFDLLGNELAKLSNYSIVDSDGTFMSVRQDQNWYFFDLMNNKVQTEKVFSHLVYLGENQWAGKKELGYQLVNAQGSVMTEQSYDQLNKFAEGFAVFSRNNFWGYLDLQGKELTDAVFGLAWDYHEGFARAAFKDGIAYINLDQQLAFYPPAGTLDMRDFAEGLAPVQIIRK